MDKLIVKKTHTIKTQRVERERIFHDDAAKLMNVDEILVRESFESPTAIENRYIVEQFGNLKGKKILDLGCGAGEATTYFSLLGAEVIGIDISSEFLRVARACAQQHNTSFCTAQSDAGKLPFKEDVFDHVFGNGVLHHVDLIQAQKEIYRVLKPGGIAAFVEPLPYNPVINVYRYLARGMRTEDEKPMGFKVIRSFCSKFSETYHKEFWLTSLLIFLHFFLIRRWNPSKVRYWKKVLEEGFSYERIFVSLNGIDQWLMKHMPFLRYFCWNTVIIVRKPKNGNH
jgi:ubiquinone/menaquinone biosynthesis C-methylase UbiE